MIKKDCSQIQDLFTPHLGGDLNGTLTDELNVHLKECDECKMAFSFVSNLLDRSEDLEFNTPIDLEGKIKTAVSSSTILERKSNYSLVPIFIKASAAILICMFFIKLGMESALKLESKNQRQETVVNLLTSSLNYNELEANNPFVVFHEYKLSEQQ